MKVLHIITGLQRAAGTSVFAVELCDALRDLGVEAAIADCDPGAADQYPSRTGAPVLDLETVLKGPCAWDVVHIHALWTPVLHRASVWAHRQGAPLVWSPHGMLTPWALGQKRLKKLFALGCYQYWDLRKAALLHVTAESEVEDVRRLGLKNPVAVVPLGVAIPPPHERVGHSPHRLLFISRVQKIKGLLNLVKAWSALRTSGWEAVIAGPDQEGHTEEVRRLAESLGVANNFRFVGPVFGADKDALYDSADCFVLPSYSENFGSVVIEALAHQVPVITTKGTPWQELETRQCGKWIDIGVEPLAVALREVMALSDEERAAMGVRGRRLVEEKYAWPASGRAMAGGYESLVSSL